VRGVSFDVPSGAMLALTGPNGSGKTSILAGIACLVTAGGSVSLGDVPLDRSTPEGRARAGLAFVPEGRRLFGRLSVEQNLIVGSSRVRGRVGARSAVERILETFPLLSERRRQRADTLSGGEAQILVIARALVSSPAALLVDEPFEGLSAEATELVASALRFAADAGAAVLLASPEPAPGVASIEIRHGSLAEVAR
jgi:branched-chain amino acid transport system ATP-binding protein